MKYLIGIIAIIISIVAFNNYKEKQKIILKKNLTCIEFLNANSIDCLDSPFAYVRKKAKEKAIRDLDKFKKDLIKMNNELNNYISQKKLKESDYQIKSWNELDALNIIVKNQSNDKLPLYDKKIVVLGKLTGCISPGMLKGDLKYYFCTANLKKNEDYRETVVINNINNLPELKRIFDKLSKLGLKREGLFISDIDIYDMQVYGKITKIDFIKNHMDIDYIKFFPRLVSDKEIRDMLENKIFWSDWNKVKEFQKLKSL
tara:strand:+ start:3304 stop:4077 length:774 start_codon:yes stop_codon:yes gene_type:complete